MTKKDDDAKPRRGAPPLDSAGYAETAPISGEEEASASAVPPTLRDGDVVAGRYRVLRYLARGGMGEVYEAEDLELGERVALKTIREEMKDKISEERFKREIQLSRKVTHPNVCRIFDVGYHHQPDGKRVVFLTMELLAGETLHERLRREGALPLTEAAGVVRQLAAGLQAAHAAGVVHRDFKSGNVVLVVKKSGQLRAVVTDFGLAHVLGGAEERQRSLSGSGGIVGTPGYMAPEQVDGGEVSPRTDVYALGVVMFEMVTGKLPFDGATPLSIATKRLTQPAPSPKKLRPDLSPKWERAIAACLERDPRARPMRPRAVLELLELVNDSIEEMDGTMLVPRDQRRVPLVRPALALLLVALGLLGVQRLRGRPATVERRAVAAVPFHPADARAAAEPWIGAIAAELLAVRLGTGAALQSFDTSTTGSALRDVGVAEGAELSREQLGQVSRLLSLDLVVVGRYELADEGSTLVASAELLDAHSLRSIGTATERGGIEDSARVLDKLAAQIGHESGLRDEAPVAGIPQTLPQKPAALRAYVEARQLFDRHESSAAVVAAERAVAAEPTHARSHLLLAEIARDAGTDGRAIAESKLALAAAAGLPRLERLYVEAVAAAVSRDTVGSITRLQALHAAVPDDLDVGVRLTVALTDAGRAGESLALVKQLRGSVSNPAWKFKLDTSEVKSAIASGDLDLALRTARRAGAEAKALGARIRGASARSLECRVLFDQLHFAEAKVACEEARRVFAETGERSLRARTVNVIAIIESQLGDTIAERRDYESLLPVVRDIGDREMESTVLNNLGAISLDAGDLDGAVVYWRAALKIAEELHDDKGAVPTLQNLAEALADQGDLRGAEAYVKRAEHVLRALDTPSDLLYTVCSVVELDLSLGQGHDLDRMLAEIDVLQARLSPSTPPTEQCEDAQSDVHSARGAFDRAATVLQQQSDRLDRATAHSNWQRRNYRLAYALAEAGDVAGARARISRSNTTPKPEDDRYLRATHVLALRLDATTSTVPEGKSWLEALSVAVASNKMLLPRLEDELEIERTRIALHDPAAALTHLRALRAEAARVGWVTGVLRAEILTFEARASARGRLSASEVADYARRARAAGQTGWADRAEQLREQR